MGSSGLLTSPVGLGGSFGEFGDARRELSVCAKEAAQGWSFRERQQNIVGSGLHGNTCCKDSGAFSPQGDRTLVRVLAQANFGALGSPRMPTLVCSYWEREGTQERQSERFSLHTYFSNPQPSWAVRLIPHTWKHQAFSVG